MKQNKFLIITSIVLMLVSFVALPIDTSAKTIKEFEAEVEKYTSELESKKNQISLNDSEVAEINKKINSIKKQITQAETDIGTLQEEIEESYEEINKKSEESKAIIEYYQISNGENSYLEYIFGATSITDMIYRMSIVEQLTEYNDKVMKELEKLIETNKTKQTELKNKQKELETLQTSLESEQSKINADSQAIRETMPTVEQQIKAAKANVEYYKKLGCGDTEDIQVCQYRIEQANKSSGTSIPSTNGFYRSIEYGYLVRGMSWNNSTASGSHMGMDMSSSNKTITVYPMASGQLYFAGYDSAGALIVVLKHNINGKYVYSTYAHMSSFSSTIAPYVNYSKGTSESIENGPIISADTALGKMGSTGNSTGPHLHLEVSSCSWHKRGGCTWGTYQKSMINPTNYVTYPSRWTNR
jgi:peptidoglycan hydrolase CwlO-like protein